MLGPWVACRAPRRTGHVLLLGTLAAATVFAVSAGSAAPTPASIALLEAVEDAVDEEQARKVLEPHLADVKALSHEVVEKVVLRQWWALARDMVARSHTQKADLSFAVRKAVRTLKDEADELLRTLNPKYGEAQMVAPAFQWAQNDTCIFLTIKYTVRWNAPGALEVTEPSVNLTLSGFNFSGLGKHSNNKYKYSLSLNLFDNIEEDSSSWSAASVGKLSVTLRKRWARKWPRLLANKKTKISNMHVWMEKQEQLDGSLGDMSSVSNSPVTCAFAEKLYCLGTDTCKKAANCTQCPGKEIANEADNMCAGKPTERAHITFKDADMDEHELGGRVEITKARNEFDIDAYAVYFGTSDKDKLNDVVKKVTPKGGNTWVSLPDSTALPETATHLLVFSENSFGEFATPGSIIITDAVLPKAKPAGVVFDDEDGEKGEVSGTVTVHRADNEDKLDDYVLHWGKSATRKITSQSHMRDIHKGNKDVQKELSYYISRSTKIPDGATHILAFSKNQHGELVPPASLKIDDHVKPCLNHSKSDCPVGISATPDLDADPMQADTLLTVERAKSEASVTEYVLYWGRNECTAEGGQLGAKNGHIKDILVTDQVMQYQLRPDSNVPDGTTHVLVFSKNKYGESEFCVSTPFEDNGLVKTQGTNEDSDKPADAAEKKEL